MKSEALELLVSMESTVGPFIVATLKVKYMARPALQVL